jgi:prevent-host-death family protein
MLEVDISKILPVTEARDSLNKIIDDVSIGDELYVLTVNGKPSAVIVGVHHLEKLTGKPTDELMAATTPPVGLNEMPADSAATPTSTPSAPTEVTPSSTPAAPAETTPTEPEPVATSTPASTPIPGTTAPPAPNSPPPTSAPAPSSNKPFVTPNTTDLGNNPTNNPTTLSDDLFSN